MTRRRAVQDSELLSIRRKAERLAEARREPPSTVHLLAVLVESNDSAGSLLRERKLLPDELLTSTPRETSSEPLNELLERASAMAHSMRASEPLGIHLVLALVSARGCAAFQRLKALGVDTHRLRAVAMNAALGLVTARPAQAAAPVPRARPMRRAVTVPLMPRRAKTEARKNPEADTPPTSPAQAPLRVPTSSRPEAANSPPTSRKQNPKAVHPQAFALDARRFKTLNALGRNLTLAASHGELDEVLRRESEVEQLLDILAKREGKNPCLVGAPGVGKTSVVLALSLHTARNQPAHALDQRVIVELPLGELLSGTGVRGALAQRLSQLRKELSAAKGRVVLFFDDIHQLFSADAGDELATELGRALSDGDLTCIGATTNDLFEQLIESDRTFSRHFTRVDIEEPDAERTSEILNDVARRLGAHHQVEFSAPALASAIAWSSRYLTQRAQPAKSIAILDLAGARCRRRDQGSVGENDVAQVVAEMAEVPIERLLESDRERLLQLEQAVAARVVGHEEAIARIARIIRRNAAGLGSDRPIGSFLLLGPTGVGKTETAKAIAACLFGSEQAMTRIDLSEYSEAHTVARLLGAPPGYIGHESGGQLTDAVRRRPYQVLLLDEVEKAHPEVLETFLPLLDEGRLTDARGRCVDFRNTVILLTSNLGARVATEAPTRRLGFGQRAESSRDPSERVIAAAREHLAPEFWNRLDETLVFRALSEDHVREIARRMLQKLTDKVYEQRDVELHIDTSVVQLLLAEGGFDMSLGARPMRRAVARWVEAPLAEALLRDQLPSGSVALVSAENGTLCIQPRPAVAAQ